MVRIKLIMVLAVSLGLTATALGQEAKWNELNQQVIKLYQEGRYSEATGIAEKALEVATKTFGPDDLHVASSLKNLGSLSPGPGEVFRGRAAL